MKRNDGHNPTQPATSVGNPANAALIVLQWLTYAFWGWTVLALSILTSTILASFIDDADTSDFTPYGIAAVLVLLPIAYVCDHFYSKKEPKKKAGAEVLVMVIHAVLFALFGIAALIASAIAVVQMLTSSTDSKAAQIALYSALVITVYYLLTFLRTLNPGIIGWIQRYYKTIMLLSVGIIALLGIIGPVAKERSIRDDKLITSSLPEVQTAIDEYTNSNKKLPPDLRALGVNGDAKQLVSRSLVKYKPHARVPNTSIPPDGGSLPTAPVYKYELCVNYKKQSRNYDQYNNYGRGSEKDGYDTYLSADDHPAGNICYKLETSGYQSV